MPRRPAAAAGGGGGGGGGGQQAQGLQIIQAITSVLNAQNSLIQLWVNFEAFRLDIYNYMGTLEVDREGYWTDEFYQTRASVHRANPNRLYPPLEYSGPEGLPVVSPNPDSQAMLEGAIAKSNTKDAAKPQASGDAARENRGHIRLTSGEVPAATGKAKDSTKSAAPVTSPVKSPVASPVKGPAKAIGKGSPVVTR